MRVLMKNGQPVTVAQFRADHPGAHFPGAFPPEALAVSLGYQVGQQAPSAPSLDDIRQSAKQSLAVWINAQLKLMLSEYSDIEQAGFTAKAMAAADVLASNPPHPVGAAMLQNEAAGRGISVSQLAQIVQAKSAAFSAVQSAMADQRHLAAIAIDQAQDDADVNAALHNAQAQVRSVLQSLGVLPA